MNEKTIYFLLGGFGCIAPNIAKYAGQLISTGKIADDPTVSIAGIAIGALLFFIVGGIFVVFVMKPRDEKDAIYKGIAIPALLLSLASGAIQNDKLQSSTISAVPAQTQAPVTLTPNTSNGFLNLLSPSVASAEPASGPQAAAGPVGSPSKTRGTLKFNIAQKDVGTVSVKLKKDNTVAVTAQAPGPSFTMTYETGVYTAVLETGEYYKEVPVTIQSNRENVVDVSLDKKSITQKVTRGLENLMRR